MSSDATRSWVGQTLWNKVPEVTIFLWIIKVLGTTVGQTATDLLHEHVAMVLTVATYLMTGLFLVAFVVRFRSNRYVPMV